MDIDDPSTFPPPMTTPPPAIDPAIQARLEGLAASRSQREQTATTGRTTQPVGRQRKRHAARGSRAAAVMMSITTTAGLALYFQHAATATATASDGGSTLSGVAVASGTATNAATAATSSDVSSKSPVTTATPSAATASTTAGTTTDASVGTATPLADGTYTGATATMKYGPVQVQITVVDGQITSSVAVQTPSDGKSVSINNRATPTLESEVLAAQTADVDTVSGATYTSDSYKLSLQSAIDLARATASSAAATS